MTDESNPVFAQHLDTDAETFIQWKGTDVCIDVHCPCGRVGHYDGDFAYALRCACGRVFEMGTTVRAILRPADADLPCTQDLECEAS